MGAGGSDVYILFAYLSLPPNNQQWRVLIKRRQRRRKEDDSAAAARRRSRSSSGVAEVQTRGKTSGLNRRGAEAALTSSACYRIKWDAVRRG